MGSPESPAGSDNSEPADTDSMAPVAQSPGTVRTTAWRDGNRVAGDFALADISEYIEDDCLVWADICRPDQEQLTRLADELRLHPTAIEDATDVP